MLPQTRRRWRLGCRASHRDNKQRDQLSGHRTAAVHCLQFSRGRRQYAGHQRTVQGVVLYCDAPGGAHRQAGDDNCAQYICHFNIHFLEGATGRHNTGRVPRLSHYVQGARPATQRDARTVHPGQRCGGTIITHSN